VTLAEERLDTAFFALADPFAISLLAISRHTGVLEGAGLISQGVNAQRRPCRLETDTPDGLADHTR
jgi:hypothetical protein